MELDTEYSFNKPGIRDPYEIPSNPKEFKKTKEEKKEKKKKEKKIKRIYFSNIKDEEAEAEIKTPAKKKRKRVSRKVKKLSAAVFNVLKNLGSSPELRETP